MFALEIPNSLQILLWVAAGITAFGVVFYKGLLPLSRFISQTEKSIPVLKELTDKLTEPNIISVIVEMAAQFKTDSGSSLRDVVNRLEDAAKEAANTVDALRLSVEGNRQLAEADRAALMRLTVLLDRLQTQLSIAKGEIMDSSKIASDAAAAIAVGVADDLQHSHDRANQAGLTPGEAADAAARHDPVPP